MSAIISSCGLFRYRLERDLSRPGPVVAILGVNPSKADATLNDPTIKKDMGFGERLGWSRILKGNKFAFRSTDVKVLRTARDPIGPENDAHLEQIMRDAEIVVAAWGPLAKVPAAHRGRWKEVVKIADRVGRKLHCFGTTDDGQPRHTLMLAYDTPLIEWQVPWIANRTGVAA
ncbi:DUF1643 domain-containing protein [Bradyrhizobium sp. PMVTL-01]|uniref:DUF1643 domain-containing protein n=1 Tax=Bradyrhizobium sp. PMVTL-01 TaxID=3434999 RepID=UPI003F718EDB